MRNVRASRIQCDETWSFCYAKTRNVNDAKAAPNGSGDLCIWIAIDADTKLIASCYVGNRGSMLAIALMNDLRSRLENRVQITTDSHKAYVEAVGGALAAMLITPRW